MLTLEPPYSVIDGYAVLPDSTDATLFYALPAAPALAMAGGSPQLSLTEYLGGGAGSARIAGGILQLTTELQVPDDALAAIAARLASRQTTTSTSGISTSGPPRVVPVVFDSGAVEFAILGRTSSPPPQGSAAPGGPFEVTFSAGGSPSLGGTNACTFQLALNENAATAVEACLDAPELPVVVTYDMTFQALRPSFTVDITADWHKVYSSLQNTLTANAWFAAADVDVAITKALEESGVHVDTVIEGGADSAAAAEKTRQQLLDWVLERLFVSMAPPQTTASGVGQAIGDVVWSLTRAIVPGASYRLKAVNANELRHLDIRATERIAQERHVRPQGMLGDLLRGLRVDERGDTSPAWPAIRAAMVQRVELDAFPRLEVAVSLVDRFATDGLRAVRVQLARLLPDGTRADEGELSFTAAGQRADWVVNLLDASAREQVWDCGFAYRVVVDFNPDSPIRPAEQAASPWLPQRAGQLLVDPREAYAVTDVTVTTSPLFSFALFPAVSVDLRPAPDPAVPEGDPAKTVHLTLTTDAPLLHWRYAAGADDVPFAWRAVYRRPLEAGGDVTTPWSQALDPWLSLPDPMPEKLQVTFFVDLPWPQITAALLQLRYDDAAADVHYAVETVTLGPQTPVVARTYSIAAGGPRSIEYRLTIQLATGGLMEGSWRAADDDRIVVDRRLVDERQVRVRLVGGTLAERGLLQARLALEARDPATGAVRSSSVLTISPGQEPGFAGSFTYLRGDPPLLQVFTQLTLVDSNGFVRTSPWASSTADLLVVDLHGASVLG